jgi:hypothetical protein
MRLCLRFHGLCFHQGLRLRCLRPLHGLERHRLQSRLEHPSARPPLRHGLAIQHISQSCT